MNTSTVLDDERIADLRSRVMQGVDADVRRRGRRTRFVAGGAAAAVVVIGLVAGNAVLGPDNTTGSDFSAAPVPVGPESFEGADSFKGTEGEALVPGSEFSDLATPDGQTVPSPTDTDTDRSVVTNGSASLVVGDPADAASDFGAWVEGQGGRIDSRTDRSGQTDVVVRVPAAGVNAAIEELRGLGELESTSIDRVDVTSQVVDLDARIAALQASIARLTDILNRATTTADVVAAEGNLTQRQAELDGLVAQRTSLGDEVELSTIAVTFSETPTTATVEPDGFLGGLRTGWNSVVETVNGIVTAAGVAAPWAAIVLVLGGLVWIARRRSQKN